MNLPIIIIYVALKSGYAISRLKYFNRKLLPTVDGVSVLRKSGVGGGEKRKILMATV